MMKVKGMAAMKSKSALVPYSFERREPKENDVVIDIMYCGICHSDIHKVNNDWGEGNFPMVPGHEIAGVVKTVGSKVTNYKVGDHVGVGCMVDSCRTCVNCLDHLEQFCVTGSTMTYDSLDKYGMMTQGGYSSAIVVNEDFVLRIPNSIPLDKAAPLLCAGITLYSPLRYWNAGPGKKVAIVGLGGLGHMGVKLAKAMGADVTVLSHSDRKKEDALKMGADNFINTSNPGVFENYAGVFDLIINTVSAGIDIDAYMGLVKIKGTLVAVGLPENPLTIHPGSLIFGRKSYAGSLIGGIQETQEMLDFCALHNITPEIEVINPDQVNVAFERVLKSDVKYRFVINMSNL